MFNSCSSLSYISSPVAGAASHCFVILTPAPLRSSDRANIVRELEEQTWKRGEGWVQRSCVTVWGAFLFRCDTEGVMGFKVGGDVYPLQSGTPRLDCSLDHACVGLILSLKLTVSPFRIHFSVCDCCQCGKYMLLLKKGDNRIFVTSLLPGSSLYLIDLLHWIYSAGQKFTYVMVKKVMLILWSVI